MRPLAVPTLLTALLALPLVLAAPRPAAAQDFEVDFQECREQLEAFARLDLNCPVSVRPSAGALERVPDMLRGVFSGLTCRTQVDARKADVYGSWILADRFDPPRKEIVCSHADMQGRDLVAVVDVTCTRQGEAWSCPPGVERIDGAGALNEVLAQYLNQGSGVWRGLEQELAKRD